MSMGQGLLHFFMPKSLLTGCFFAATFGGSFARHNIDLRFCDCQNATIGGSLNVLDNFL